MNFRTHDHRRNFAKDFGQHARGLRLASRFDIRINPYGREPFLHEYGASRGWKIYEPTYRFVFFSVFHNSLTDNNFDHIGGMRVRLMNQSLRFAMPWNPSNMFCPYPSGKEYAIDNPIIARLFQRKHDLRQTH